MNEKQMRQEFENWRDNLPKHPNDRIFVVPSPFDTWRAATELAEKRHIARYQALDDAMNLLKSKQEESEKRLDKLLSPSWQPVETIPKDKKIIVGKKNEVGLCDLADAYYCDVGDIRIFAEEHVTGMQLHMHPFISVPTHWTDMPELPKESK